MSVTLPVEVKVGVIVGESVWVGVSVELAVEVAGVLERGPPAGAVN